MDTEDFNPDAKRACQWTREQLSPANLRYLETLPESLTEGEFTLVHGSPRHSVWEYILYPSIAGANFSHFDTRFCLVGHTHVPIIYRSLAISRQPENPERICDALAPSLTEPLALGKDRLIINPGSVGQPRDGDPRASYAILDTDDLQDEFTLQYRRVSYSIEATQAKMVDVGLPARLVIRLGYGW
jgi:diadenosine tetraphosphatase ApaH/serine/threonine PP2A family protein phosphatase